MSLALLLLFSFAAAADVPLTGEVIRGEAGVQWQAAAASDGEGFFVAWEQVRHDADVVGSRVSADGEAIDRGGIPVQPTWQPDRDPAVVFNGGTYVVVFATNLYGVKLVEITRGGEVVTEKIVVLQNGVLRARIAWSGTEYLLAWTDGFAVRAVRLDRAFERIGGELAAGAGADIAVASNGSGFAIASMLDLPAGPKAIASNGISYAVARESEVVAADESGSIVKRTPLPIVGVPAIAWDGEHYLVAWSDADRVYGAELDAALNVTRAPARLVAAETRQRAPSLAASGSRVLLTWSDGHIRAATFERGAFAAAAATASSVISTGLPDQTPFDAIRTGGTLQTLWLEDGALYFGGRPLAPASDARVAWNGSVFAIAAQRGTSIEVEGVAATPLHLGTGSNPRIASNGRDFGVAWNTESGAVAAAIVSAGGEITATRTIESIHGRTTLYGIVPKDGGYVLFYLDSTTAKARTFAYFSAPFASAPVVIAGGQSVYGPYTGAVGSNGHDVAYAWSYPGSSGVRARINENGGEMAISDSLDSYADAVAWDGTTPLFLFSRAVSRFLLRGGETVELPRSQRFVLTAEAYVYTRDLDTATRAYVRFLTGTKRRAAR